MTQNLRLEETLAPKRLVFIDDDPAELDAFAAIVEPEFNYVRIQWPPDQALSELIGEPPDIFVLDLYLPPRDGPAPNEISPDEFARQESLARQVAQALSALYPDYAGDPKRLLRDTMDALIEGRKILDAQWSALGQSPQNGIQLLNELKALFPGVPIVFYSRKITPEDVVDVLEAGADAAIRKGGRTPAEVLDRLRQVMQR